MNMRTTRFIQLTSTAVFVALGACTEAPKPKPPSAPVPAPSKPTPSPNASAPSGAAVPQVPTDQSGWRTSGQNDDAKVMEVGGLSAPKPASWTWQQPSMQFRTLQYAVPGEGATTGAAELIVSLFAGGDGGPIEGNVQRWAGQFKTAEGGAVTPTQSEKTVDGMKVLLVELAGTYNGMGASGPKPDQLQLGAIIEAPGRRVFIRLLGPKAVVERERANWDALVNGIKQSK